MWTMYEYSNKIGTNVLCVECYTVTCIGQVNSFDHTEQVIASI